MGGLDPLTWYFAVVHVLDEEGGITGTYPNLFFQTADVEDNPDNPDDPNNPDNPHNPDRPEPNPNPGTGRRRQGSAACRHAVRLARADTRQPPAPEILSAAATGRVRKGTWI